MFFVDTNSLELGGGLAIQEHLVKVYRVIEQAADDR